MARIAYALPLLAVLVVSAPQDPRTIGKLGAAGTFFYPEYAGRADHVLAEVAKEKITGELYGRYLAARFGTRHLQSLAYEIALARECRARGLARGAPVLARGVAAAQLRASGRTADDDPDASLQRRFANDALIEQRSDAIIRAGWLDDPQRLRTVFDHRYGQDGVRVHIRQILVSFAAIRDRMPGASEDEVHAFAKSRAEAIQRQAQSRDFATLLPETDDRITLRVLRDPARASEAGVVPDYNYRRYGKDFAVAVRGLAEGEISAPVRTETGYHIIELLGRKVTKFADVEPTVRRELGARKPSQHERSELRRELLAKHGFTPKNPARKH